MKPIVMTFCILMLLLSSKSFSQSNKVGVKFLLNTSSEGDYYHGGLGLYYCNNIYNNIWIKPYFEILGSNDKYIKNSSVIGMDVNYSYDVLSIGAGLNYNIFAADHKGNIVFFSNNEAVLGVKYKNTLGYDISGGLELPISQIFAIKAEFKYIILRPVCIYETIDYPTGKMTGRIRNTQSKQKHDYLSSGIGIQINF